MTERERLDLQLRVPSSALDVSSWVLHDINVIDLFVQHFTLDVGDMITAAALHSHCRSPGGRGIGLVLKVKNPSHNFCTVSS